MDVDRGLGSWMGHTVDEVLILTRASDKGLAAKIQRHKEDVTVLRRRSLFCSYLSLLLHIMNFETSKKSTSARPGLPQER